MIYGKFQMRSWIYINDRLNRGRKGVLLIYSYISLQTIQTISFFIGFLYFFLTISIISISIIFLFRHFNFLTFSFKFFSFSEITFALLIEVFLKSDRLFFSLGILFFLTKDFFDFIVEILTTETDIKEFKGVFNSNSFLLLTGFVIGNSSICTRRWIYISIALQIH